MNDQDIQITPTSAPGIIPDAPPANSSPMGADNQPDPVVIKTLKQRFWLSLLALFMSGVFGVLALGAVSVGYGLANELEATNPRDIILTYKIITGVFITLAPACIWAAYKLRPGGG